MSQPVVLLLFAFDLLLGFCAGWLCCRSWQKRASLASAPARAAVASLLDDIGAKAAHHTSELRALQAELEAAGERDGIIPRAQLARAHQSTSQFEEDLQSARQRLVRLTAGGPDCRGLLRRLKQHGRQVRCLAGVMQRSLDAEQSASRIAALIALISDLSRSNEELSIRLEEARQLIAVQEARIRRAEQNAQIDCLTRLPNRRAFDERLAECHREFQETRRPYSLVLLDIDRFKHVNDRHGHQAGDAALVEFARMLTDALRPGDFAARIGGEEFSVLLPGSGLEAALPLAQGCRRRVQQTVVRHGEQELCFTVSGGIAVSRPEETAVDVLQRADAALYAAKAAGRNQVQVSRRGDDAPLQREAALCGAGAAT